MATTFYLGAAGLALAIALHALAAHVSQNGYYVASAAAPILFLLAMGAVSRGLPFPRWAVALPGVACGTLILLARPAACASPRVELGLLAFGCFCLLVASLWLARRYWTRSVPAALLVAASGGIATLEFLRLALLRYAFYSETYAMGFARLFAWMLETAVAFGLAALFAFAGSWVGRATRERRRSNSGA
jgi:hypothetical protein